MSPLRILAPALVLLALSFPAVAQDAEALDDDDGPTVPVAEARRTVATPMPAAGSAGEAEALVLRQRAAFALGQGAARAEALRRLVELTETRDKPSPWAASLWRELARTGNQTEALEMGERLADDRRHSPVTRAATLAMLGQDYTVFGQHDKARATLRRAEDAVQKLPEPDQPLAREARIHLIHLRAAVAQGQGDFPRAEESIRAAVAAAQKEVDAARAMPPGRARDLRTDGAIRTRIGQMRRQVSILMAQGKHAEAEAVARYALRLAEEEKTGGSTVGLWQSRIAFAKLGQRRYVEAHEMASAAVATMAASGVAPSSDRMVYARLYQVQSLFGLERWADADQLLAQMRADADNDLLARAQADSPVLQAFVNLKNGRIEPAMQRVEASVRYRARHHGEAHASTVEAKAVRAMVFQAMGRTREALQDYDEAFAAVFAPETTFGDAEPAGLRGFFMPHALRGYLQLVAQMHRDTGGKVPGGVVEGAFRVADRLRASVVQQALIDSAARAAATNPQLAELVRREQDLRVQARESVVALARQLEEETRLTREFQELAKAKRLDAQGIAAERERMQARQAAIRKTRESFQSVDAERRGLVKSLRQRFPEYQALVNPKPPAPAEVGALLKPDERLVSIYPAADATFVWAVAPKGEPVLHVSALRSSEVTALVAAMRKTLDLGATGAAAPASFDFASSAKLYAELLAPLGPALAGARSVIFAANGSLAEVPLATLVAKPGAADPASAAWLVRDTAVAQVSSVAAFQSLRQAKAPAAKQPFAGYGDPAFRPASGATTKPAALRAIVKQPLPTRSAVLSPEDYAALPPLPETRSELQAIARALGADPAKDVFLGREATRQRALSTDLRSRRVIAFATHGLKPGDLPGLSRPALAMAATGSATESPLLVLDDVLTMKLDAEVVVLSACNTASDDGSAEEALSGLARGFFFAGARSVLVTHWAVETTSAEQLVTRTFANLAKGATRAEALRRAQLEMIEGKAGAAFAHPFFWAPYALSGDPG